MGIQVYNLYINGKACGIEYVYSEGFWCNLGDPGMSFYNKVKKAKASELAENFSMYFYFRDAFPHPPSYGKLTGIALKRDKKFFEARLHLAFHFNDVVKSNINPLKLIHRALQLAESMGFEKEGKHDYYGRKVSEEWYNMFAASFHYRSSCNDDTLEQKTLEAIAQFNKLLDKVAGEMAGEINKGIKT